MSTENASTSRRTDQHDVADPAGQLERLRREQARGTQVERQREQVLAAETAAGRHSEQSHSALSRLQRLTAALARTVTLDEVIETMATTVRDELDAAMMAVWLVDEDEGALRLARQVGGDPMVAHGTTGPADPRWPVAWVSRHHRPIAWRDATERDQRFRSLRGTDLTHEAHLVAPLAAEGDDLGAVVLGFEQSCDLDDEQHDLACATARQCARALWRARLHERLRIECEEARFRAGVGEVLTASLDLDETLRRAAEMAGPSLGEGCVIALLDEQGTLRPEVSAHRDPTTRALLEQLVTHHQEIRNTYVTKVAETGEPLVLSWIADVLEDEDRAGPQDAEHRAVLDAFGATSTIVVPLRAGDEVLGVLAVVATSEERRVDRRNLPLLQSIATQAAVAIRNARVHREACELSEQLQRALESRLVIERVKGLLAERHGIDADEAFQRLRREARSNHQRIHDAARAVLEGRADL
ncbi:GAF domain-containing protein [Egibacter rhizosphaerae]|uniref:GAF domain-containing protein n=1 Tax=Egibacter rhizosphaerae TaxID=1670831 RepID=UPI0013F16896|nr:GAF domain-containing protein [Egibacter rhizosphaerae]